MITTESSIKKFDRVAYMREYANREAASVRDIRIRDCANMSRRLERLACPKKFMRGYFGDRFWRAFTKDQEESIEIVVDCARYNTDEIIVAQRGDWKSETLKHLVIYVMMAKISRFPVWFGATAGDAKLKYDDIKSRFHCEEFASDFPEVCDPIIALRGRQKYQTHLGKTTELIWKDDHCSLPVIHERPWTDTPSPYGRMKLTYRSLDGHLRGANIGGCRPDFLPMDDLETEESASSDHQIETREQRLDNAVGGLGGSETAPRIILGTIQNNKCLTKKKLEEWGGKRYQAIHRWPDSERAVELRDEYIDLRKADRRGGDKHYTVSYDFYELHREEIEASVELASPENKSRKNRKDGRPLELSAFQKILNAASDKGWAYVNTEIQNDPDEDENKMETPGLKASTVASRIHGGKRGEFPEEALYRVRCLDVGKFASHWVDVAWHGDAIGRVVDYGIAETPVELDANSSDEAIELAVLKMLLQWRDDAMTLERPPDLCLVDAGTYSGARDEGGNRTQRGVYEFIRQAGGSPFAASKGWDQGRYRQHKATPTRRLGDNWNISYLEDQGLWLYNVNVDFWKGWVHQRFLTQTVDDARDFQSGSLSLFAPPKRRDGSYEKRTHHSFAKHIVSEEWREEFVRGKGTRRGWYKLHKNNHWLDAMVLACVAGSMLGIELIPPVVERPKPTKQEASKPFANPSGQPYLVTER